MEQENMELKQTIKQLKSQITDMMMEQMEVNCKHLNIILDEGIPTDPISDEIELTDLDSEAIRSIKTTNDTVTINYNSSKKEYHYTCNDIHTFKKDIHDIKSFGRYVNKCIKNGTLTPI